MEQPRSPEGGTAAGFPAPVDEGPGALPRTPVPGQRPPVRRVSVRGQVLDALRRALAEGELTPGEVYSAPALGERFGVSATPVREAMQQLALEGAVEVVPNRGYRITECSGRELVELAEVRALIEVPVILRLVRTVAPSRWAELRPRAQEMVRAAVVGDRAGYDAADRAFHCAVLALAGNRQLVRTVEDLHRRGRSRVDLAAGAASHVALLDALVAGDLPLVESLLRTHFAL